MGRNLVSGVVGGLAGTVVFATMATMMVDIVVDIGSVTLMELIGHAVGAGSLAATWGIVLVAGAVIGAVFGVVAGGRDVVTVTGYGLSCGIALAVLLGFVAVPMMLGVPPGSPAMHAWFPPALAGALMFTSVLVIIVIRLTHAHGGRPPGRTA